MAGSGPDKAPRRTRVAKGSACDACIRCAQQVADAVQVGEGCSRRPISPSSPHPDRGSARSSRNLERR